MSEASQRDAHTRRKWCGLGGISITVTVLAGCSAYAAQGIAEKITDSAAIEQVRILLTGAVASVPVSGHASPCPLTNQGVTGARLESLDPGPF